MYIHIFLLIFSIYPHSFVTEKQRMETAKACVNHVFYQLMIYPSLFYRLPRINLTKDSNHKPDRQRKHV